MCSYVEAMQDVEADAVKLKQEAVKVAKCSPNDGQGISPEAKARSIPKATAVNRLLLYCFNISFFCSCWSRQNRDKEHVNNALE